MKNQKEWKGQGRAFFNQNVSSITERVNFGQSANSIYEELGGRDKFGIEINLFRRYVRELKNPKENVPSSQRLALASASRPPLILTPKITTATNGIEAPDIDASSMRLSDEEMRLQLGLPLENEQSEEGANNE